MSKNSHFKSNFSPSDRQKEIYIGGLSGQLPEIPMDFARLERQAKERLSTRAFTYIAGGAGINTTVKNNRSAFDDWQIVPRMLRDVSQRDTSIKLFGDDLRTPFLSCPIGVLELAHPKADLALAKANAALGIPMIFSNQASVAMEKCAAVMGNSPRWFQLYWSKSNDLVGSLVRRAEACGCSAITVTLDTTLLGWRVQDLDLAYLPFLEGKGIAQYISDPVFQKLIDEPDTEPAPARNKLSWNLIRSIYQLMSSYPGGFFQNLRTQRPLKAVRKFISIYSRPSLTWEDLAFLRTQTKLPVVLKGVLHPDDARKAIDYGMDGIIVSNHGGRQVDGSIASIRALPAITEVVNQQIPVLLDSGIRGGADMFKALALGATAVCLGRPYVYALALGGEAGVKTFYKNMMADFELTMGLAGCRSIAEIDPNALIKARK
ncbi:MAG: lactate 2-monooxygenase [Saprospiraceae bacterium]